MDTPIKQQRQEVIRVTPREVKEAVGTLNAKALAKPPKPPTRIFAVPMSDEVREWDRREGETSVNFARFHCYLVLGPERSVIASIYEYHKRIIHRPLDEKIRYSSRIYQVWRNIATKNDWQSRAAAWDQEQARLELKAISHNRMRSRVERKDMLDLLRAKTVEAISGLDPEDANWRDVVAAVKVVAQELRQEHDDTPKQRMEVTGENGKPIEVEVTGAREKLSAAITNILAARRVGQSAELPDGSGSGSIDVRLEGDMGEDEPIATYRYVDNLAT
jgi:hypothetical protein